jgi:hypothetical protein
VIYRSKTALCMYVTFRYPGSWLMDRSSIQFSLDLVEQVRLSPINLPIPTNLKTLNHSILKVVI